MRQRFVEKSGSPQRPHHGDLFRSAELVSRPRLHVLPTGRWLSDPARQLEPYVEAQVWNDEPVSHLLGGHDQRYSTRRDWSASVLFGVS